MLFSAFLTSDKEIEGYVSVDSRTTKTAYARLGRIANEF